MTSQTPRLRFSATPLTGNGIPTENNEPYQMLLDQALSGGAGTASYLQHILKLADFGAYLQQAGNAAFTTSASPDGGQQAVATDGTTTLNVGVTLDPPSVAPDAPPIRGVATVRLALPNPYNIVKITQLAVSLAELPAGFVLTSAVWQALLQPLLSRLTTFVVRAINRWLETDVGEDAVGLTDTLDAATADVAESVAEESAEAVVEESVVAEVALDLSAACPALAGLAVLLAIPLLISALGKQFILHIEVNNATDIDFAWSIPYIDKGTVTVQPSDPTLPKMGRATDSWGDVTSIPVVFQATFSSMNTSGFQGIGFVMAFSPAGYGGEDTAAVIAIPWIANNAIWVGDPGRSPNWDEIYAANRSPNGQLHAWHGNQIFATTIAIDALSGNHDEYHCVVRMQPV